MIKTGLRRWDAGGQTHWLILRPPCACAGRQEVGRGEGAQGPSGLAQNAKGLKFYPERNPRRSARRSQVQLECDLSSYRKIRLSALGRLIRDRRIMIKDQEFR